MPFRNENTNAGIPRNDPFLKGKSDHDTAGVIESGFLFPWASEKEASYLYYDCTIGVMLDSGIVVHNRLPQVNRGFDTLASATLDDPNLDGLAGFGVNLRCQDQYQDIVQRMGHARYWFRLWGQALRVGYQIPIPGIKVIGGVQAVPYDKNPQWGFNSIVPCSNYGGIILWRAQWSLWYTTATQPTNNTIPAGNPSAHINVNAPLPTGIQSPYSQPDDNAVRTEPANIRFK